MNANNLDYVNLGGTGLEVSPLCLGTWMYWTPISVIQPRYNAADHVPFYR